MNFKGDVVTAGVIIVIGACLFGLMLFFVDGGGQSYDIEMEYEDWVEYQGDALGIEGPIEITNGMIHATGTGTAKIINVNGTTTTIRITPAHATLILMNGQSNGAYYSYSRPPSASDIAKTPTLPYGTAFYFGWPDGMPVESYDDPSACKFYDFMDVSTGQVRVCDKGPEFCKTYAELTGKKVIWVCLAIPGKWIAAWDRPNGTCWVSNCNLMDYANAELDKLPFKIDRTITLWAQGESDYRHSTGQAYYEGALKALIADAPKGWGRDIDAWYLLCGRTQKCGWVNDAFENVAATTEGVFIGSTVALVDSFTYENGLLKSDSLHYTQTGDNALANAAARSAAGAEDLAPIYLIQATATGDVGSTIAAPRTARCYRTDSTSVLAGVTWDSSPSSSAAGTFVIYGTAANVGESAKLEFAPGPLLIVTVSE